jgi:hypothetical protein
MLLKLREFVINIIKSDMNCMHMRMKMKYFASGGVNYSTCHNWKNIPNETEKLSELCFNDKTDGIVNGILNYSGCCPSGMSRNRNAILVIVLGLFLL